MADLLQLLREYTVNKKQIVETDNEIIFGDFAWPKSAKTNFVIYSSDKTESNKDYYTLGAIYYLLKHVDLAHAQYVRQAAAAGVAGVRLPDRRDLLGYLNGDITTASSIDRAAPVDISLRRPVKRSAAEIAGKSSSQIISDAAKGSENNLLDIASPYTTEASAAKKSRIDEEAERERLNRKLDATTSKGPLINEQMKTSSLMEAISVDKINSIRAKFRATMRQQIKTDEVELTPAGSGPGQGNREVVRGPLFAADLNLVREITSREKTWKNRVTVLQSQSKEFFQNIVNGILKNVKIKEEGAPLPPHFSNKAAPGVRGGPVTPAAPAAKHGHHHHSHSINNPAAPAPAKASNVNAPSGQQPHYEYSRYDQERFKGGHELDTAGFKIDTDLSYRGVPFSMMAKTANKEAGKLNNDPRTRHALPVSGGNTPNPDGTPRYRSITDARVQRSQKGGRTSRTPIIIIPASTTSLITMLNAKDLLQDLRYVSNEEKKAAGQKRDNEVLIQRMKSDGTTVPYRIVDQPLKLSPDDWERVVAVFVQGPAWQFKGWPIGSEPVIIFNKLKAFHLKSTRMPTDENVQKWNVFVISLDERRHLDKANFQQFWELLDKHIAKYKPHLRY